MDLISFTAQSDHAAAQKKMFELVEEELQRLRAETLEDGAMDMPVYAAIMLCVFCWDHKRTNTAGAAEKGDEEYLIELLGAVPDPQEWGKLILTAIIRQCCKAFGHRRHPYEFGHGVSDFPGWVAVEEPSFVPAGLLRVVGNRNDVYFESAMTITYMAPVYVKYLFYLRKARKDGPNKLDKQLLRGLGCVEAITALRARALIWLNIFQPLRVASNSTDVGLSFLDMERYASATEAIFTDLTTNNINTLSFFSKDGFMTIFHDCVNSAALVKEVNEYRKHHHREVAAVFATTTTAEKRALKSCLSLQAKHALAKFQHFASSQLVSQKKHCGKKDYCPDSQLAADLGKVQKAKLAKTHPTNRYAEAVFSANDLFRNKFTTASQYVVSGLTAALQNKVIEWLYSIADSEERNALILFALSPQGQKVAKKQFADDKAAQTAEHLRTGADLQAKASTRLRKRLKKWLAVDGVTLAATANEFAKEYALIGKERTVGLRRKFLEQRAMLLQREGVASADLPAFIECTFAKKKKKTRKRDPDEVFEDLREVFAKRHKKMLTLVDQEYRPNAPGLSGQDYEGLHFREGGHLTPTLERLLDAEKQEVKNLQAEIMLELTKEAEAASEPKADKPTKKKKKKPAKERGRAQGGKAEKDASDAESSGDEIDTDDEAEAELDQTYTFGLDMQEGFRRSMAVTHRADRASARTAGNGAHGGVA